MTDANHIAVSKKLSPVLTAPAHRTAPHRTTWPSMSSQTETNIDPWNKETRRKFQKSQYLDPCQEAASRSIRCLNRNEGDRAMCTDYFEAYRACKKEWVSSPGNPFHPELGIRANND
ncbi:hypothetical protein F5X99DRAFT_413709 [Biscogniauxia marginata]|nr:hypothetical protein F5X99DRAFT_413709 [Biscogniauxia marginata]